MTRTRAIRGLFFPGVGPLVRARLHGPARSLDGLALVDTGAGMSAVDRQLALDLGLPTHRAAEWKAVTRDTPELAPLRVGALQIADDRRHWELELIEVPNLRHRISGYQLVALIGWDFLDQCKITIDGPGGVFALELPR
ncbi:MAG: hypothetical protein ABMA64_16105 [Myxococcota bacterium]